MSTDITEVTELTARVTTLEEQITRVESKVDRIEVEMRQAKAVAFNRHFRQIGTDQEPWRMVPFDDGKDPTAEPHNLPALKKEADVDNLSHPHLGRYERGYGLSTPVATTAAIAERKARLIRYLGGVPMSVL